MSQAIKIELYCHKKLWIFQFDNVRKLTDEDVLNVSCRLQKSDIRNLGVRLGVESSTIETCFTKHLNDYPEVAHDVLTRWRKTQDFDFIAYENLCKALMHPKVKLRQIAAEDLGFRP